MKCPFLVYRFLFVCTSHKMHNPDVSCVREYCRTERHASCPHYS